ncbi:riboflavin synthase subunit alpha [Pseudomonas sp. CCNWLW23]|uniref:riboflavin synthase subunit alpha n=1 Tax=Pseudomonas sp. CCNWLW23 TaxID=3126385 RepID=UPI003012AF20
MYTGIVQAVCPLISVTVNPGHNQMTVNFTEELLDDLKIGASISVEGTCLSVTQIQGTQVSFDAMTATLERTNIRYFQSGQLLNIERAMKINAEVGGHLMGGHIATTAVLTELSITDSCSFVKFCIPANWSKYVFPRGFIGVNGCSLTVADMEGDMVTIYLIPETLRRTTFPFYKVGDFLNIEVEQQTLVLVDVVERTIKATLARNKLLL